MAAAVEGLLCTVKSLFHNSRARAVRESDHDYEYEAEYERKGEASRSF